MRISRAGTTNSQRGVTLIEMLIVMTLIALVAGLSYPSISAGLDSLRLRSTSDQMLSFLNTSIDHAERLQQVVELVIAPSENALVARSPDRAFSRRFELPENARILQVLPALASAIAGDPTPRRFLIYPGGSIPKIGIEIASPNGRKRMISVDPVTGTPVSVVEAQ